LLPMKCLLVLFHLLVVWSSAKATGPNLIELKARLSSLGRSEAAVQHDMQLQELQSVQDLSNLLDEGRQKLAATRLVLEQAPAAAPAAAAKPAAPAAPAAATGVDAAVDLIQPPQLQPLALPSYGPQMQIDELADIQREQLALRQKKLMVSQQQRVIQESEDNAAKLQQLIAVNKQIAERNQQALAIANQHLTDRIKAYGDRLAQEAAGTAASGAPAAGTTATAFVEAAVETTHATDASSQSAQFAQFQAEIQQRLQQQNDNIQHIEEMLLRKRRHRRTRRANANTLQDDNDNTNANTNTPQEDNDSQDGDTQDSVKPVSSN